MKLHSIVDQITNSSGTTYIFSDKECLQNAKDVLQQIMGILNVKGNVEDYFDVRRFMIEYDYEENEEILKEVYEDTIEDDNDAYDMVRTQISISPKDNSKIDIAPLMDGLFKAFHSRYYDVGMIYKGEEYDMPDYRRVE